MLLCIQAQQPNRQQIIVKQRQEGVDQRTAAHAARIVQRESAQQRIQQILHRLVLVILALAGIAGIIQRAAGVQIIHLRGHQRIAQCLALIPEFGKALPVQMPERIISRPGRVQPQHDGHYSSASS